MANKKTDKRKALESKVGKMLWETMDCSEGDADDLAKRIVRLTLRKTMTKGLLRATMDILAKLRDFHDEHCEHMTTCPESQEADRVFTELEKLLATCNK